MKKIKLDSGLYLTANKEDNIIKINMVDKQQDVTFTAKYRVDTCKICNKRIINDVSCKKQDICQSCESIIKQYSAIEETKTPIIHKKDFEMDNIKILNLEEIYNIFNVWGKDRVELLLKFAICGFKFKKIAEKLNIRVESAKRYYNYMAKSGLVSLKDKDKPIIKDIVKYEIIDEQKSSIHINSALKALKPCMEKWLTLDEMCKITNKKKNTMSVYIYRLKSYNPELVLKGKNKKYFIKNFE